MHTFWQSIEASDRVVVQVDDGFVSNAGGVVEEDEEGLTWEWLTGLMILNDLFRWLQQDARDEAVAVGQFVAVSQDFNGGGHFRSGEWVEWVRRNGGIGWVVCGLDSPLKKPG